MNEFKSFYKQAAGGEGERCRYATRLDLYGCGCAHDCSYCYAKSLLDFRGLWHPEEPGIADIEKVRRKIAKLERGSVVRLGGMTDCFQPVEVRERVTLEAIKALNDAGVGYLVVTKSPLIASSEYMDAMDPELAHIQLSVSFLDASLAGAFEHAPDPRERVRAAEALEACGFDVSLRLSPFTVSAVDAASVSRASVSKCLVEFLRVNHWIEKWLSLDFRDYTVKSGGYRHLPLDVKARALGALDFEQLSVCEDVPEHFNYWRDNVNHNPEDCCNLRRRDG